MNHVVVFGEYLGGRHQFNGIQHVLNCVPFVTFAVLQIAREEIAAYRLVICTGILTERGDHIRVARCFIYP
ncbi:Uncharacterised protein [Shigella sonnei]|nr:Uncharacterised protein [Shigella sonnei]